MSEKKQKSILDDFMEGASYSSDPNVRDAQKAIRKAVELNEEAGVDLSISYAPPAISVVIFFLILIIVAAASSDFSEQAGVLIIVVMLYAMYYIGLLVFRKLSVMRPVKDIEFEKARKAYGAKGFGSEDDLKDALK